LKELHDGDGQQQRLRQRAGREFSEARSSMPRNRDEAGTDR
jgi:hypothetical protein